MEEKINIAEILKDKTQWAFKGERTNLKITIIGN